jgi:hypothetical protein
VGAAEAEQAFGAVLAGGQGAEVCWLDQYDKVPYWHSDRPDRCNSHLSTSSERRTEA